MTICGNVASLALALAVAALSVAACSGGEPEPEPSPAPVPTPTMIDPCSAHHAAFRAAMTSATGTCATDAECGCFNPVVPEAGCGGITDAATASRLAAIEASFHRDHCPWPHQCGPLACEPACREGVCANAGTGGMVLPTR